MIVFRILINRPGMYIAEYDIFESTAKEKYDYNYERIFGVKDGQTHIKSKCISSNESSNSL